MPRAAAGEQEQRQQGTRGPGYPKKLAQQKWMDKHEEEQQQPGLWLAEAESDGAYYDESATDIDRLIASVEQDDD